MYTCGIIVESLEDAGGLEELAAYFEKERLQEVSNGREVWHIRQYGVPRDEVEALLPKLAAAIKPGWYSHLFDLEDGILYVVLKGRSFQLPTRRDQSWEEMIAYGESVGLDRKWSENVPLKV